MKQSDILRRVLRFLRPYWPLALLSLLLAVGNVAATLPTARTSERTINAP